MIREEPCGLKDVFVPMLPMGGNAILGLDLANKRYLDELTGTFLLPFNAPAKTYKFINMQATASRRNARRDSDACSFSDM
jgi:hypothetical protein